MPETNDPARTADPIGNQPTVSLPPELDANAATLTVDGSRETIHLPSGTVPEIPGYEILGELGRGGMGVVYTGQTRLGRPVALKMILAGEYAGPPTRGPVPDARPRPSPGCSTRTSSRSTRSARTTACPYFSLEFVDGGSLDGTAGPASRCRPAEAAALVETLARAVHYAHEQGVVHRDLKPANILLQPLAQ